MRLLKNRKLDAIERVLQGTSRGVIKRIDENRADVFGTDFLISWVQAHWLPAPPPAGEESDAWALAYLRAGITLVQGERTEAHDS